MCKNAEGYRRKEKAPGVIDVVLIASCYLTNESHEAHKDATHVKEEKKLCGN
jgi:hypothetical protein